jgi:hypothetical protein
MIFNQKNRVLLYSHKLKTQNPDNSYLLPKFNCGELGKNPPRRDVPWNVSPQAPISL